MPNVTMDSFYLNGGLVQEFLPDNIINANLRGYGTFFNKNTPADYVAYSVARYAQQNPQATSPFPNDTVQVLPGENGKENQTQSDADSSFEKRLKELLGVLGVGGGVLGSAEILNQKQKETTGPNKNQPDAISPVCEQFADGYIPFRSICNYTVDGSKRLTLVVVGILLLALGIWALR